MDNKKDFAKVFMIAGSEPLGCCGIQADIKAVSACGGFAAGATTLLVDMNTTHVKGIHTIPVDIILNQSRDFLDDVGADCIKTGMLYEKQIVEAVSGLLREYPDVPKVIDPVMVDSGGRALILQESIDAYRALLFPQAEIITPNIHEARVLIKDLKPDVIFSKGGFVAVPVVFAAKHYHIPVIIHESDMTPGLANKLCIPSAKKVCCNFPETLKYLPADKAVLTGSPIREDLLTGDRLAGLQYTHLSASKPVLLVIGGSLGSVKVNTAIRKILPRLLESFQVIHVCGKGNLDDTLIGTPGYVQYEYVDKPLKHLFAAADLVVSRAGANSICELLALRKPNILIPLSAAASRGDQILNARSFAEQGFSAVLEEEQMTDRVLLDLIHSTYDGRRKYIEAMENSHLNNAVETIMNLINSCAAGQESAE